VIEPVVEPVVETVAAVPAVVAAAVEAEIEPTLQQVEELIAFNQANAEAVVAAGQSLALGLQKITSSLIEWSQASLESGIKTGQALVSAGSVDDVIELSQSAAKHGLDTLLEESTLITTLSTKLVEDSFAPLRSRVTAVVDKLSALAA
jgi:phasin family protein